MRMGADIQSGQGRLGEVFFPTGRKLLLRKYVKAVCHACQNRILSIRRDVITRLLTSLASVVEIALGIKWVLQEVGSNHLQNVKRTVNAQTVQQGITVTVIKKRR